MAKAWKMAKEQSNQDEDSSKVPLVESRAPVIDTGAPSASASSTSTQQLLSQDDDRDDSSESSDDSEEEN